MSGDALYGANVSVEGEMFKQDSVDPLLWKGKVTVPKDGITFEIVIETADKTIFTKTVTYFNKTGAIKPLVMGINPGIYIMIFDPLAQRIAKVDLLTNMWEEYLQNSLLKSDKVLFDFNSSNQHAYTIVNGNQLVAAGISKSSPVAYFAGSVPDPVNITFDGTNKRVIILSKNNVNGVDQYAAYTVATGSKNEPAFINGKTETTAHEPADFTKIWDVPADAIKGTFVQFNYHRNTKTLILADERTINGTKRTIIQGFSEVTGEQVFTADIGSNISNIAINNNDGIIYVAENKDSILVSKLKAITIATGKVEDLGEIKGTVIVANYTDLRMDNNKGKLYIGDVVADSIYEINLATKVLSELSITAAQVIPDETVEN